MAALAVLERKMDEANELYGRPASFGAWVQRVATAIGLDRVKLPTKEYNVSPSDAARLIDQQVREWQVYARKRSGLDEDGRPLTNMTG